jgi:hypothetical protein
MEGRLRKRKLKRKRRNYFWLASKISESHDVVIAINPQLKSKIGFQTK